MIVGQTLEQLVEPDLGADIEERLVGHEQAQ